MALRAGYYGLKTKILNKVNKWDQIVFPRSEQAVLGAKNLLPNNATTQTITGITFTVNSDGTVTANGTATALAWLQIWRGKLKKGKYIVNGCPEGGTASDTGYRLGFWNETPSSGSVIFVRETGNGVSIEITDETLDYAVYVGIGNTTTVNDLVFKPMIRLATDTDPTYAPFTMTNEQLTASAADQKTAINAIITAATGATDFAAFKAAVEAITPVTRSLSKEASPEDVPEEVTEKEKSVTKKTTKKTVKEGE